MNGGEAGVSAVSAYLDQLLSLEQKVPGGDVQIPFKWKDAFDRGSIFGGRISLTVPSLAYEKAATMFNLAASYSMYVESITGANAARCSIKVSSLSY